MTDYPEYSAVGGDLVAFKPTPELRFERRIHPFDLNSFDVLQQKWVASKTYGDVTYTDNHWRDVPLVQSSGSSDRIMS
jgi:hypothetical protein